MKRWQLLFLTILFSGFVLLSACGTEGTEDEDMIEEEETETIEDEEVVEEEDAMDVEIEENEETKISGENPAADTEEQTDTETVEESTNDSNEEVVTEIVDENDAFRIFEPAANATVGNEFIVRGEASTANGTVHYEFEDGHNILDEGTVDAAATAPDWGAFEFTITFDEVAFEVGTVILYEELEDGSRVNQLYIPVTVE